MIRRPPRSTRTDTLVPYTPLFRAAVAQRRIGVGLEGNLTAAAQALVGGDHAVRLAVLDAPGEGIRREAAEHHRVDRADARAGQHGIGGFRNHRHVDGDAVALLDAARLQGIGEAADVLEELTIGDVRSEEHTSELQSLMRISYAVFCLKKKKK